MRVFLSSCVGLFVLACCLLAGCGDDVAPDGWYEIAVTNSYIECAVRDLWDGDVGVLCLAPPGMCPGHFDISPAQVRQLKGCKLLLRFDFQQGIEQRLARLREGGLDMQPVPALEGLCVPETYVAICREISQILARTYPEKSAGFEARLAAIEERLAKLAGEVRGTIADSGISPAAALTSNHQAKFAEWLRLEPIATFVGSDVETVANIDHCLKRAAGREVRFVIANRQEGSALAQALADRCGAQAVVFGNFPETCEQGTGFDQLVRENVKLLCEAATR